MDATAMVVAPGLTPGNIPTAANQTNNKTARNAVFDQVLAQTLNETSAQTQTGQNTQLANLLQGAGQLNQMMVQLLEQVAKGEQKGQGAATDATSVKTEDKLVLPEDLAAAIMQIMQSAGFNIENVVEKAGNGQKAPDMTLLLASLTDEKGLKGEITTALQKIIKESGNLEQFAAKLEQLISGMAEKNSSNKTQNDEFKAMTGFLEEIKQLVVEKTSNKKDKTPISSLSKESVSAKTLANDKPADVKVDNTNASTKVTIMETKEIKPVTHKEETKTTDNTDEKNILVNPDNARTTVTAQGSSKVTPTARFSETVFNQIVKKAEIALGEGQSEMKIQLKPDFLGKVNMQIKIEEGIVTAKFAAESMQVKQLIEANLNNLRQNLLDQGFKVDQLQVSVGQEKDFSGQQTRQGQKTVTRKSKVESSVEVGDLFFRTMENESTPNYGNDESSLDYRL